MTPLEPGYRPLQARELSIAEALGMSPVMHVRSEAFEEAYLTATVVRGPAVILGFGQRAGRVIRLDACAAAKTPVHRRMTSGTAAYVGEQAILWALALPHVDSMVPGASLRTLLNRNVRPFLRALSHVGGGPAHYFGREWISVGRRPAVLLGFEVSPRGAVLLEFIAGMDAPVAIPAALATEEERAVDRWLGKAPAGLGELVKGDALTLARTVMEAVAASSELCIEDAPPNAIESPAIVPPVSDARCPLMPGLVPGPGLRVPIGWLDTAINPATGEVWLGGDALLSAHVYLGIARGDLRPREFAMEGASIADLHEAVRLARG